MRFVSASDQLHTTTWSLTAFHANASARSTNLRRSWVHEKIKILGFFTSCCGIFSSSRALVKSPLDFLLAAMVAGLRVQRFTAVTGVPES
jgi:hypothetical protein